MYTHTYVSASALMYAVAPPRALAAHIYNNHIPCIYIYIDIYVL